MGAFTKPAGLKYTTMAMYIDARMKEYRTKPLTRDEEDTIYKYLYWLCIMIAVKGRYFQKPEDYEEFALVAAGKYFLRLVDPRQEGDSPELKPITSILNYIKKTLYPSSVDWRRDNFSQILNPEANKYIDPEVIANNMKANIQSAYSAPSLLYMEEDVRGLPQQVRQLVYKCQFRGSKDLCYKLYLSCLLSLLNNITLTNKSLESLRSYKERKGSSPSEAYINRLYNRAGEEPVIL